MSDLDHKPPLHLIPRLAGFFMWGTIAALMLWCGDWGRTHISWRYGSPSTQSMSVLIVMCGLAAFYNLGALARAAWKRSRADNT